MRVVRKAVAVMTISSLLAIVGGGAPVAAARQQLGSIEGIVHAAGATPLPNLRVQLRDVQTGQLVATTVTDAAGQYAFTGLTPGTYLVEAIDAAGNIIAASGAVSVAAGAAVTGVTVTVTATAVAAAVAAGGLGAFFTSTAGIVVVTAAAVGVTAAVVATREPASPAQ